MVRMTFWDAAERDLAKFPRPTRQMLLLACRDIFDDWAIGKPLAGKLSGYRVHRIGIYRIVYTVRRSSRVEIAAIGHRKDIDERLR